MNNADYYDQCQEILTDATSRLGFPLGDDKICEISSLITEAMGGNYRCFHNFEHLLMFKDQEDPIITIAGLFHDLVYIQVDRKITFNLTVYLAPLIQERIDGLYIKSRQNKKDKYLEIILKIFGLNIDDNLSNFRGHNEFLSALCTAQILDNSLPLTVIVRIVTIIELTIPFRQLENNISISQQLEKRLSKVNQQFQLGLKNDEIILTIIQGVKLANLDVSGFASTNVKDFINNTWLLLPETNHILNDQYHYLIKDCCIALIKTTKFIQCLFPENIFHCYHDYPSSDAYESLINRSKYNLNIAQYYFAYHIIGLSILQAFISRFTFSLPLSFFFPHKSNSSKNNSSFIDYIIPVNKKNIIPNSVEDIVSNLISAEFQPSFFPYNDLGNFVILIFNYLTLKDSLIFIDKCLLFFEGEICQDDFLNLFPSPLIKIIEDAIAQHLAEVRSHFVL
ncbi:hypothetical protein VKI22_13005 [Cyanobacterium aponinum UTEX 3221]|uniref:hypothetical protein n=1 Tax=Cyanobacterium aponinum TaxID=379064 RepID=UPI002B4C21C9|nr:hypothetical protein [Cyanobacterium aponinum]WRL37536.1 hypothetical protein VKI22_13005 [Cyanobacterium aponinum UTEX 3221]